jgi:hypothetical protein
VASYADGPIELVLPYADIQQFLNFPGKSWRSYPARLIPETHDTGEGLKETHYTPGIY